MTTAVLLCGQLRTWRLCGPLLRKYLLDAHACDVFMSVDLNNSKQSEWKNPTDSTPWEEMVAAIEFYRPKKVWWNDSYDFGAIRSRLGNQTLFPAYRRGRIDVALVGNEFQFSQLQDTSTGQFFFERNTTPIYEPVFRQYYFVREAIALMTRHVADTGTVYARVLRTRFDQLFYTAPLLKGVYPRFERNALGKILLSARNLHMAQHDLPTDSGLVLPLDSPGPREIYVFGAGDNHGTFYVNDQYWQASYALTSAVLVNFYDELVEIVRQCERDGWPVMEAWTESWHARFLCNHCIAIKKSVIGDGDFVRGSS